MTVANQKPTSDIIWWTSGITLQQPLRTLLVNLLLLPEADVRENRKGDYISHPSIYLNKIHALCFKNNTVIQINKISVEWDDGACLGI